MFVLFLVVALFAGAALLARNARERVEGLVLIDDATGAPVLKGWDILLQHSAIVPILAAVVFPAGARRRPFRLRTAANGSTASTATTSLASPATDTGATARRRRGVHYGRVQREDVPTVDLGQARPNVLRPPVALSATSYPMLAAYVDRMRGAWFWRDRDTSSKPGNYARLPTVSGSVWLDHLTAATRSPSAWAFAGVRSTPCSDPRSTEPDRLLGNRTARLHFLMLVCTYVTENPRMRKLIDFGRTIRAVWFAALRGISWQIAVATAALFVAVGTPYESNVSEIARYIVMGSLTTELFKQYGLKVVIPSLVNSGRSVGRTPLYLPLMLAGAPPVGVVSYFVVRFFQEPRGQWVAVFTEFDLVACVIAVLLPLLGAAFGGGIALLSHYHGQNKSAVLEGKELTRRELWLTALFFAVTLVVVLIPAVRQLFDHFR